MRRLFSAKPFFIGAAGFGLAAIAVAAGPQAARAQDPAGCYYDYRSLTDDDILWGKAPGVYCPYGYGPGMPYGAAPQGQAVAPRAQRERWSERTRRRGRD